MKHKVAKIAFVLAILLPSVASAQQTFVTPNGTVIDWYGNIISQPISVVLFNSQLHPMVKPKPTIFDRTICDGHHGNLDFVQLKVCLTPSHDDI